MKDELLKVAKFGGSSLASAEQFKKVGAIIRADASRRYVVDSAPGKRSKDDTKVTDLLYRCYEEAAQGKNFDRTFRQIRSRFEEIITGLGLDLNLSRDFEEIHKRFESQSGADYAASRGEYLNGKILAKYLGFEFVDAATVICFDKDGNFLEEESDRKLAERLSAVRTAVIPGFYGAMPDGRIKTFSRGGSDITGSIIARAIHADLYENWTDVSGFLAADPRLVKNPRVIDVLTYRELRELSYMGASVLHEEAIFPVRSEGIPINIRNTNRPEDKGTLIVETTCHTPEYIITGIAGKKGFVSISIDKDMMNSEIGFCRKVLQVFEDNHISIEHMPSGIDTCTIFVEQDAFIDKEQRVLAQLHRAVKPDTIEMESNLALIAIVGRGMKNNSGCASKIFSALSAAKINIRMIDQGSSELNIIIGVRNKYFEEAIRVIYNAFVPEDGKEEKK
ncbi:MAG: aspartate kinase [Lachnospiraceae bacterium]|nr:aspartate kinase [Lachnospiraceae bacterium]